MNLARGTLALGALALADSIERKPPKRPQTEQERKHAALLAAAGEMPCDVERRADGVATVDERGVGLSFFSEWRVQAASLAAELGSFLGRPRVSNRCAVSWSGLWLELQRQAEKRAERYAARRGGPFATGNVVTGEDMDLTRDPDWTYTPIGEHVHALRRLQKRAKLGAEIDADTTFPYLRELYDETKRLSAAMDSAGLITGDDGANPSDLLGYMGDRAKELAQKGAEGTADVIAGSIEYVIAPILGTAAATTIGIIGSALAPYLLLAGVGYVAWRQV